MHAFKKLCETSFLTFSILIGGFLNTKVVSAATNIMYL